MAEDIINSRQSLEAYKKYLDAKFEKAKYLRVTTKTGKQRTSTENASLHLFCDRVAKALNDAGFDFRVFIKDGYPVPWTEALAKDYLWRPIQEAVTGHNSTTKPERGKYGEIYDVLNVKLAEHGIYVPWPCKETMQAERESGV
jgi:hypothetical protein